MKTYRKHDRSSFIWLLESSRSDYPMAAFDTEELALEALEAARVRLVKRWKNEVTEIDNGAFMVMDDVYTIRRDHVISAFLHNFSKGSKRDDQNTHRCRH